jgi:phosphoribosylglycinamide formyltransferase-1
VLFTITAISESMVNVAVFGSGAGSNFRAILDAIARGAVGGVTISLVISDKPESGILEIARGNNIPAVHLSRKQYQTDGLFIAGMRTLLQAHQVKLIVLAGYLKMMPAEIIREYPDRIINLHPALLPKFGGKGMYGMRVHEAVLASGERESGATVHVVDEEYDHGRIIAQQTVPVLPEDTPDSLAQRIHRAEHQLLPETINRLAAILEGQS